MLKQRALNVEGGIVTWRVTPSKLQALEDRLKAIGYPELVPEPRTAKSALKAALKGAGGSDTLVRPLKQECGFTLVSERRGETANSYSNEYAVMFDEGTNTLTVDPHDQGMYEEILDAFAEQMQIVSAAATGKVLVGAINILNGISMRDTGGVYWIPESKVDAWERIAEAVEDASVSQDKTSVYLLRTVADESAMRAVRDGINQEIVTEVERITADIDSGELGKRALAKREELAVQLGDRLAEYETILGETLGVVREQLEECRARAAEAALMAASEVKA